MFIEFRRRLTMNSATRAAVIGVATVLAGARGARAQATGGDVFTLDRAIQYAVDHYPALRAAVEQVAATTAGVTVARTAYLPRLDSLWQSNRATANNIFGQMLPQSVIPSITGPVLASASSQSVWGSATGALLTWEPADFGLRKATVAGADAVVAQARAGEALTRLEVESAVGLAFLDVVAADRAVAAAQADVDRRDALARSVRVLVDNQLRPGADASRADAERAVAQTRLIQSQQLLALAQTTLARVLGTGGAVRVDGTNLLNRTPEGPTGLPNPVIDAHPLAQTRQAAVDAARAQQQVLSRTDLPRLYVQSSVFARGSGANADGTFSGGADGLGLERANWAAGVQIIFPNVFDFSSLHARQAAAAATARAEIAKQDEARLTIAGERQAASVMLQAARAVAANTPVQVAAAQQSAAQATARYQAGLASIVEVAEAQSLLAQSDVQDQVARVDIWRALLAQAIASGSIDSFLVLARP
jgi:outer membrane protein TolC